MKNIDNYKKNIPKEFMEKDQWLIFKKIPRKNPNGETKISKIPYSAITLSAKGWNERQNFASFYKALSVLVNNNFDGLSFALTEGDPFVCIDLDNCIKDGQISLFAKSIVKTFEGSYMELSASAEGIHIFLKGNIPANLNQQNKGIEIYKMSRCIAMTGDIHSKHFEASTEVLDFDEDLQKLYKSLTTTSKVKSEGSPRIVTEKVCQVKRACPIQERLLRRCAGSIQGQGTTFMELTYQATGAEMILFSCFFLGALRTETVISWRVYF